MKGKNILLAVDFLLRTSGNASFALFVAAIYQTSGRASDIGLISLATVVPAILTTIYANRLTSRFSSLGILKWAILSRVGLFAVAATSSLTVEVLLVAAALQSWLHQSAMASKMALDAQLIQPEMRHKYLSRKAILSNISIIVGPPLGGILISYCGIPLALVFMFFLGALSLALVWNLPSPSPELKTSESGISIMDSLRHVWSLPLTAAVVLVYCIVAVVLEVQAPLLFPFVHEVYGAKSSVTGMLLGLGGLGGIAGGLLAQRFHHLLNEKTVSWLVVVDGLLFLWFTRMESLVPASLIFVGLGVMGAVTLIVVEGTIQRDVDRAHQPFIFSLMQLAGGAGGASLGIVTGFLAEAYGAKPVLSGAALSEVLIGFGMIALILFLRCQTRLEKKL